MLNVLETRFPQCTTYCFEILMGYFTLPKGLVHNYLLMLENYFANAYLTGQQDFSEQGRQMEYNRIEVK